MTDPAHAADRPRRRGLIPADRYLGWAPCAWLIHLTIFLVDPAVRWRGRTLTGGYIAATLLGICIFLVSYF